MPDENESWRPWAPQLGPQLAAIEAQWCDELFFGGARGGGKSDYLLGDYAADVPVYGPEWRGILFRKTYPELEEIVARSKAIFPPTFPGAEWGDTAKTWTFPGGATLRMRYLERDADAARYQGHQYTWIGFDELTNWPDYGAYKALIATLRNGNRPIPFKRIRSSGNPGGPGHQWVKARFVDHAPLGYQPFTDPQTGMVRMFIPSKVGDNRILLANDPGYVNRLKGVGSAELIRAWLDGDWSVITGAFFDCWSNEKHIVRPHELPEHWTRFRSFDWGFARPFSVGWWAVSDGELPQYPRGALIRYREWYGSNGEPNVGLRLTAEEVAEGIKAKEKGDRIKYGVADPSIFDNNGGPSIAERMLLAGVTFQRGDNKRTQRGGAMGGWDQMRARMVGEDGVPMIYTFSTCRDSIRTIPALQHDPDKPEDLDTDGEDHAGDDWRYGCMSRPWVSKAPETYRPTHVWAGQPDGSIKSSLTFRQLVERQGKKRRAAE